MSWWSSRHRVLTVLPELALIILIVLAMRVALNATALLQWPHDPDLYRDMAAAQRLLDCRCLADPLYRGETIWYNPLVPALVALLSAISRVQVHVLYARAGPSLNLLPVLGFYVLTLVSLGRRTAALATFAFIFLVNPGTPAWGSATYSAWLFAGVFTQALFYVTLVVYERARRSASMRWRIAVGVGLGLTFLGHTAPALILGSVLVLGAFIGDQPRVSRIAGLIVELATAALVSTPLLYSIVVRYHLHQLNPMPATWSYPARLLDAMPSIPLGSLWVTGPLLIVGVGATALNPVARRRAASIWLSLAGTFVWLGYHTLFVPFASRLADIHLPVFVPSFHFVFYLRALSCMLVACGALYVIDAAAGMFERRTRATNGAIASALAVLLMAGSYRAVHHDYVARHDLTAARFEAWRLSTQPSEEATFEWIRRETTPGDVFLASERMGLYLIGPAGGSVVVVDRYFSNPFVDLSSRTSDWKTLWATVRSGEQSRFQPLASKYALRYVIVDDGAVAADIERRAACFLEKRQEFGAIRIYEVHPAAARGCG